MLLVIDVGNTQTSFGVFKGTELVAHWRAETKASRTSDEHAATLFPLLERSQLGSATWEAVILCSVVPGADHSFENFCRKYLDSECFRIHCGLDLGYAIDVEIPSEVGADRLANAAYAAQEMSLPAVVVDFGTATTLDVVTSGPVYRGGIILPGVRLGVEALGGKTAKLPVVELRYPPQPIGRSTSQCIQSGILYGYLDAIDGLLGRIEKQLGETVHVALTGGFAGMFRTYMKRDTLLRPHLTLEGALSLYSRRE